MYDFALPFQTWWGLEINRVKWYILYSVYYVERPLLVNRILVTWLSLLHSFGVYCPLPLFTLKTSTLQ